MSEVEQGQGECRPKWCGHSFPQLEYLKVFFAGRSARITSYEPDHMLLPVLFMRGIERAQFELGAL